MIYSKWNEISIHIHLYNYCIKKTILKYYKIKQLLTIFWFPSTLGFIDQKSIYDLWLWPWSIYSSNVNKYLKLTSDYIYGQYTLLNIYKNLHWPYQKAIIKRFPVVHCFNVLWKSAIKIEAMLLNGTYIKAKRQSDKNLFPCIEEKKNNKKTLLHIFVITF